MADDFDGDDGIDAGEEPEEQADGPSEEELAEAEVPGPREEQKQAKQEQPQAPDPRDQQIANLNRAIRQERDAKRAAKRHAAELATRQQRLEQRHEVFMRRIAEASGADVSDLLPDAGPRLPPEDQDPLGHLKGHIQQLVSPLLQKIEGLEQQLTTRDLNAQVAEVDRYVADDAAVFHGEHPDYGEAEDFMLEAIARDTWNAAKRANPNADEDDLADHVGQYVARAIGNLKVGAYRDRKSLASIIYAVAQQKGWQPGQLAPAQNGNGARRAPARGKAGELQRNLQKSGAGLAGLERAPRKGPVTLGSLADMDDDEFDEYTKDPKRWKKLTEAAAGG